MTSVTIASMIPMPSWTRKKGSATQIAAAVSPAVAPPQQADEDQRQQAGDRRHEADRDERVDAQLDPRDAEPEHQRLAADRERVEEVLGRVRRPVREHRVGALVEEVVQACHAGALDDARILELDRAELSFWKKGMPSPSGTGTRLTRSLSPAIAFACSTAGPAMRDSW
jgi:hypothetical protein